MHGRQETFAGRRADDTGGLGTYGREVSRGDIEGRAGVPGWSVSTINTYLTRLCDKRAI